jgi:hypothetical protein
MNRKVVFFLDNYFYNGTTYWIDWITKKLELDTIIATNGFISDKNSKNFVFMSKLEALRSLNDRMLITFPSQNIQPFIEANTNRKILYIENLSFLYTRFKEEKYAFINNIEKAAEDGIKVISSVEHIDYYTNKCDNVISLFDYKKWELELCNG